MKQFTEKLEIFRYPTFTQWDPKDQLPQDYREDPWIQNGKMKNGIWKSGVASLWPHEHLWWDRGNLILILGWLLS